MSYARYATQSAQTPQTSPIPGRVMAQNDAGGYGFEMDLWTRVERFLILGTAQNTIYVDSSTLTEAAARVIIQAAKENGPRLVAEIVAISETGRAPKNDPAIFALVLAVKHGDLQTRQAAYAALNKVCRIGTHLFKFVAWADGMKISGKGFRRAVGRWYTSRDPESLAYQLIKYRNREGWTHRDVLRIAHPVAETLAHRALFDWACGRKPEGQTLEALPEIVKVFDRGDTNEIILSGLPWEALATEELAKAETWKSLIDNNALPVGGMVRNLGRMTARNVFDDRKVVAQVVGDLTDRNVLAKGRIHPLGVAVAQVTYASGQSRGGVTWTPAPKILDALDQGFDLAFHGARKINGRLLVATDTSGSMQGARCSGAESMTAAQAAATLAVILTRLADDTMVIGVDTEVHLPGQPMMSSFYRRDTGIRMPTVTARSRLDDVVRQWPAIGGGTDMAAPVMWANTNNEKFDAIIIVTDEQSYAGDTHLTQAMHAYRVARNPNAKLIVLSTTSSRSGAALVDPHDSKALGISGFDASVIDIIADFVNAD